MSKATCFLHLLQADIKRLFKVLPGIILAGLLILIGMATAAELISDKLYKPDAPDMFGIAFYIPADEDDVHVNIGIDLLGNMTTMKESLTLIRVDSVEEGREMVAKKEAFFFINIPENFFYDVFRDGDTPIEIVTFDTTTITAFMANELFLSFARYFRAAQSAIFAATDYMVAQGYTEDAYRNMIDVINLTFLDKALNKDAYAKRVLATDEGGYPIREHYMGVALLASVAFTAFLLFSVFQKMSGGTKVLLSTRGITRIHRFFANFITYIPAFMAAYLILAGALSVYLKRFHPAGIITFLPVALILSGIAALVTETGNSFIACLTYLIVILLLLYIGGGVFPNALLPTAIREFSAYLPGRYMIETTTRALIGGGL